MNYDRMSRDGVWAYTQAILDLTATFNAIIDDLTLQHKRISAPIVNQTLSVFLEHRADLRTNPQKGFLYYSAKENKVVFRPTIEE